MAIRAFIGDNELDLPEDFTIPVELHSPLYDLSELRVGDFTMDVSFPFTPRNRVAFGFADEPAVAGKVIRFDNFRMEDEGRLRLSGHLLLREANEEDGRGAYVCDFFTHLPEKDIFARKLEEVMTKEIDLGEGALQIVLSAANHNSTDLSADGETGTTIKFPPHWNRDFYGGSNKWWGETASQKYEPGHHEFGEVVWVFVDPWTSNEKTHWEHTSESSDNWDPEYGAGPWDPLPAGVVNNWNAATQSFRINSIVYSQTEALARSRYNLVPFLQLHDVIREVAKALGYRAEGDYMQDEHERRALIYSNYALDRRNSYRAMASVETQDIPITGPNDYALAELAPLEDAAIYDPHNLIDGTNHTYKMTQPGKLTFRARGYVELLDNVLPDGEYWLYVGLRRGGAAPGDVFVDYWKPALPSALEYGGDPVAMEINLEAFVHPDDFTADHPFYVILALHDEVGPPQSKRPWRLTDFTLEVIHETAETLNVYSGEVRYKDHVPDLTVAEFLSAIFRDRGLAVSWNLKERVLRLDYAERQVGSDAGPDIEPYRTTKRKVETRAKRRFVVEYGDTGDGRKTPEGYDELPPVPTREALPPPPSFLPTLSFGGKKCLVQNEHRYYHTEQPEEGETLRTIWVPGAVAHTPLRIEAEGEEERHELSLAPLPMGRVRDELGTLMLLTELHETGRSPAFATEGRRPPLRVTWWVGTDTMGDRQYPFSTTTGRSLHTGVVIVPNGLLDYVYATYLARLMRLTVLEERVTALFHFPPSLREAVSFSRPVLLGNVPMLPIRTAEAIGAGPLVEVEMRKVKDVPIRVVTEDDGPEADPDLWTPQLLVPYMWFDVSHPNGVTLVNGDEIETFNDVSGNGRHLVTYSTDGNPKYALIGDGVYGAKYDGQAKRKHVEGLSMYGFTEFVVARNSGLGSGCLQDGRETNTVPRPTIAIREGPAVWGLNDDANVYTDFASTGALEILGIQWADQDMQAYVNGTLELTDPTHTRVLEAPRLFVGGVRTNNTNYMFRGDLAEMIFIPGLLTPLERQKVEGYLAHKWGLAAGLPGDHPYKDAPPTV